MFKHRRIKSAKVGSDLRADRREWRSEINARICALRAKITHFVATLLHGAFGEHALPALRASL
jgi:hypothetical protein